MRQLFGITMSEQEVKDAYTIRNVWAELQKEVETIDDGLEDSREHFTEVTVKQVKDFSVDCSNMLER